MSDRTCSVAGCERRCRTRGLCGMHYQRLLRSGGVPRRPILTVSERFWSKVDKRPGGCWLWTASTDRSGYGQFFPSNAPKVSWRAHRWAYMERFGPVASDVFLLHSCDNPPCVNPDHLRPGTQADNMADCAARGRVNRTVKLRGEQHPNSRMTYALAAEIRRRRWDDGVSVIDLVAEYGFSTTLIYDVVRGDRWMAPSVS